MSGWRYALLLLGVFAILCLPGVALLYLLLSLLLVLLPVEQTFTLGFLIGVLLCVGWLFSLFASTHVLTKRLSSRWSR